MHTLTERGRRWGWGGEGVGSLHAGSALGTLEEGKATGKKDEKHILPVVLENSSNHI